MSEFCLDNHIFWSGNVYCSNITIINNLKSCYVLTLTHTVQLTGFQRSKTHAYFRMFTSYQEIHSDPRPCVTYRNMLFPSGDELIALPNTQRSRPLLLHSHLCTTVLIQKNRIPLHNSISHISSATQDASCRGDKGHS